MVLAISSRWEDDMLSKFSHISEHARFNIGRMLALSEAGLAVSCVCWLDRPSQ